MFKSLFDEINKTLKGAMGNYLKSDDQLLKEGLTITYGAIFYTGENTCEVSISHCGTVCSTPELPIHRYFKEM